MWKCEGQKKSLSKVGIGYVTYMALIQIIIQVLLFSLHFLLVSGNPIPDDLQV